MDYNYIFVECCYLELVFFLHLLKRSVFRICDMVCECFFVIMKAGIFIFAIQSFWFPCWLLITMWGSRNLSEFYSKIS